MVGAVVLLASMGSACGIAHIRALREAQTSFSRAAELENAERLNDHRSISELSEVTSAYGLAAAMTEELLARKEKDLRQDNLLCTAYMLRAISLWRLGQHDAAVEASLRSTGCEGSQRAARELALLQAIPGLVRIDEANARVADATASKDDYDATKAEIARALTTIETAGHAVPPNHPVHAYLLLSSLAAVRVWQVAVDREKLAGAERDQERRAALAKAEGLWREYRRFLECQAFRPGDPSVEKWRVLLGLNRPAAEEVDCGAN